MQTVENMETMIQGNKRAIRIANEQEEQEKRFKHFDELLSAIKNHDHNKFDQLEFQVLDWNEYVPTYSKTMMETALADAIFYSNETAFSCLMAYTAPSIAATNGKKAGQIFDYALSHGTSNMISTLIKLNSALIKKHYLIEENVIATCIRNIKNNSILRYGKFQNEEQKMKLVRFLRGENVEFLPNEKVVIEYHGPVDKVNILLFYGADFLTPDSQGIAPLDVLNNPTDPRYAKWIKVDGLTIKNVAFVKKEGEAHPVLQTNQNLYSDDDGCTKKIPVVIEYHFSELRAALEKAKERLSLGRNSESLAKLTQLEQKMEEHHQNGKALNDRLMNVQQDLVKVKKLGNYTRKEQRADFREAIQAHPNQKEAYEAFQIGMEAIRNYAVGVQGGAPIGEGPLAMVLTVMGIGENFAHFIPVIGNAVGKILGFGVKAAEKLNEQREKNITASIASLATQKDALNIFESVARTLVTYYSEQYERLLTKEEAESSLSKFQTFTKEAKEKVLYKQFMSPTRQATAFGMIWMIDEVFRCAYKADLQKEIQEKGLERVLISAITEQNPPGRVIEFWNEVTNKLGVESLWTKEEKHWHPHDFWTAPGVVVTHSETKEQQYFAGEKSKPEEFGWRMGSLDDVKKLNLKETKVLKSSDSNNNSPSVHTNHQNGNGFMTPGFTSNSNNHINGINGHGNSNGRLHHQPSYNPPRLKPNGNFTLITNEN